MSKLLMEANPTLSQCILRRDRVEWNIPLDLCDGFRSDEACSFISTARSGICLAIPGPPGHVTLTLEVEALCHNVSLSLSALDFSVKLVLSIISLPKLSAWMVLVGVEQAYSI